MCGALLNDDKDQYINYCPLCPDAATHNAAAGGKDAGGMGPGGKFRVQTGDVDPQKTAASLQAAHVVKGFKQFRKSKVAKNHWQYT